MISFKDADRIPVRKKEYYVEKTGEGSPVEMKKVGKSHEYYLFS